MTVRTSSSDLMRLSGYVPLCNHGFALCAYQSDSQEKANAWYVAVPEIEGDRQAPIGGFDILEMDVNHIIQTDIRLTVGDPWQDVFIWRRKTIVGIPREIFDTLAAFHRDMRQTAPLTFLDLALGAGAGGTPEMARQVLLFLQNRLGNDRGLAQFRDVVIRPGVLLELHRQVYRKFSLSVLPERLRNFLIESLGQRGFSVKIPESAAPLLGGAEDITRVKEAIAEYGERLGTNIQTMEVDDIQIVDPRGSTHARAARGSMRDVEGDKTYNRTENAPLNSGWFNSNPQIGIDIGTSTTRVIVRGRGIVLAEPSVVALATIHGTPVFRSAGDEALRMYQDDPSGVELIQPLRDGAIADIDIAELMIKYFIRKARGKRFFQRKPNIVICVPVGSTGVERTAIYRATQNAGANRVWLIEEPMAAAIGAGMPVLHPVGSMVVDIGSGKTEVAVLAFRGFAYCTSVRVGGDRMDEVIASHVRRNYDLLIGDSTAERIKKQVGLAKPPAAGADGEIVRIKGRTLSGGGTKEVTITQREIAEALSAVVATIVEGTQIALENLSPELAADIVEGGIVLTGGGALLSGLDEVIRDAMGVTVTIAEDPLMCVATGIGRVLDDPSLRVVLLP